MAVDDTGRAEPAPAPSIREVAELTARLRALSASGADADPAERAAFLADKDALIARITNATYPGAGRKPTGALVEQARHALAAVPAQPAGADQEWERREQLARWHADDHARGDTVDHGRGGEPAERAAGAEVPDAR